MRIPAQPWPRGAGQGGAGRRRVGFEAPIAIATVMASPLPRLQAPLP